MKTLLKTILCLSLLLVQEAVSYSQDFKLLDDYFPVRSFYVSLPPESYSDEFITFVRNDLAPGGFNHLVVRVNWTYEYKSHPELIDNGAWSEEQVKSLVKACRECGITLVPMINMLGHQSWADKMLKFLEVYPQFDERPEVPLPAPGTWKWPNEHDYYCKSYCPNHPEVHKILFECIDELLEVFEAKDFHCGMDEVFDLASDNCPRCKGMSKAKVLSEEINRVNRHLNSKGVRMYLWADRLLDGTDAATGYGEWSGSYSGTAEAIDMIDKNVVICDWHYRVAEQSAVLFALKGFDVITCGWMHPAITSRQLEDLERFRTHSSSPSDKRYLGFMQTVWSGFPAFMDDYRSSSDEDSAALNYKHLKTLYLNYIEKFKDKPFPQKDGRRIRGI